MATTTTVRRWTAFNLVGAGGILVQLGTLALLVHVLRLHDIAATAVAVEAAVLHNFCWHQRWTWRDRPATFRGMAVRFWRFQALNGAISLAGNVIVTAALARIAGLDPIAANAIAIAACSLLTFAASERFVFVAIPLAASLLVAPIEAAAGQRPDALSAWRAYEAAVDARYRQGAESATVFFAQDVAAATPGWRAIVEGHGVSMRRFEAPDAPDGRIHHWAGSVLVPGARVAGVVARLRTHAGREAEFYEDVIGSKLLAGDGDRLRVYMKLRRTTVITATFNTEHTVEYRRLGVNRASSRSSADRIVELADAGTPRERERTPDEDRGFLWRLNAYWRFEQTPGGVIVECESVSLSRSVPALLRPVAGPIVDRVARESLEKTLRAVRDFLRDAR